MNFKAAATACATACAALLLVAGCGKREPDAPDATKAAAAASAAASAAAFTVLAGSELRELEGPLVAAARAAGVELKLSYAGTLDIVERINGGEAFDAILPPNGAYPALALTTPALAREKLFYSRVALGVKAAKVKALGWDRQPPTWAQVAQAAKAGTFRFGMTNPTSSNTGMSALFAVAAAAAKKTEDLSVADVDAQVLKDFLSGQRITAGSSGWLADTYAKDPSVVDGLVNYEAVILRLNETVPAQARLTLVYPQDGVITADYPLMLLQEAKRGAYVKLVAAFKATPFQREALQAAFLRPSNTEAPLATALPTAAVAELAFPNRLDVIDEVLSSFQSQWRRPATSIFVLDTSGSMKGARLDGMREALKILGGADAATVSSRYARFQQRERVLLVPFASTVATPTLIGFDTGDVASARESVRGFAEGLQVNGGTAVYSALATAEKLAREELARDNQRFVSIVLLTDGESNEGMSFESFRKRQDDPATRSPVRIFPILFGEANLSEMKALADLTGGRVFDARTTRLATVFKEIRGYQ